MISDVPAKVKRPSGNSDWTTETLYRAATRRDEYKASELVCIFYVLPFGKRDVTASSLKQVIQHNRFCVYVLGVNPCAWKPLCCVWQRDWVMLRRAHSRPSTLTSCSTQLIIIYSPFQAAAGCFCPNWASSNYQKWPNVLSLLSF